MQAVITRQYRPPAAQLRPVTARKKNRYGGLRATLSITRRRRRAD
jgi:hypothetical protein